MSSFGLTTRRPARVCELRDAVCFVFWVASYDGS